MPFKKPRLEQEAVRLKKRELQLSRVAATFLKREAHIFCLAECLPRKLNSVQPDGIFNTADISGRSAHDSSRCARGMLDGLGSGCDLRTSGRWDQRNHGGAENA